MIKSWQGRQHAFLLLAITFVLAVPAAAQAAPAWFPPEDVSPAGQGAFDPQVAVDNNGNAVAVWNRFDGSFNRIQAAYKPAGGPWLTVQTISDPGQDAFEPQVAIDSDGDAVSVWTRSDGTKLRIQAASRAAGAGTTFATPQTLSASGQDAFSPDVAIEPDGDAVAVWTRLDGTQPGVPCCNRIQAAMKLAGGSFGAVETISVAGASAFKPQVDVDPSGNAIAVWYRENGGSGTRVQSAVFREGNYVRPQGASAFRASMVLAYKQCNLPGNRTHGPSLTYASCNPPVQESDTLTMGTTDANGFSPQGNASVKVTVCPTGTTGSGTCVTPAGMSSPDVRFEILATDVRCRTTNVACPGGAGSDYIGRTLVTYQIRITDKNNGALGTDSATVQDISYNVPVDCTATGATIGATCNVLTRASAVLPGSVVGGKRAMWEMTDVLLKDAGANGTGYGAGCPSTCGDGDEKVFLRQGIFVP